MPSEIRVRYIRSVIGNAKDQRDTVKLLGLRRLNQVVMLPDNPSVRGMVRKVAHLVRIEEGEDRS